MTSSSNSLFSKLVLGLVVPTALVAIGLGSLFYIGKAEPEQVLKGGSDEASKVARLPIVETGVCLPFDGDRSLDIDLNGVVVPFREVTVAAEVAGRISEKSEMCEPGRFVQAGDLLFKIDPRDYQLEVDRLARLRDQEYAQLREWEQEVANSQKSLELAEQDVALQEKEIQRLEKLPDGFASAAELDQARRARLVSANQRQVQQNQLDLLNARKRRLDLSQQLASTQLELAKLNLTRTEIRAPLTGVIITENAETDSFVQKGATLCTIEDTTKVEVKCNIRMDQLMTILDQEQLPNSMSLPGRVSGYTLPQTPVSVLYRVAGREDLVFQWEGHLSRYDGIGLDQQSRTVPCRIVVDDPQNFTVAGKATSSDAGTASPLVRGMFVEAKIHTKPTRSLLLIPKLALKPGNLLWKFREDRSVLNEVESDSMDTATSKDVAAKATKVASNLNVAEWDIGRIEIIKGLQPIRMIDLPDPQSGKLHSYWVVETTSTVSAGDRLISTPLANVQGDGNDRVRTRSHTQPAVSIEENQEPSLIERKRS